MGNLPLDENFFLHIRETRALSTEVTYRKALVPFTAWMDANKFKITTAPKTAIEDYSFWLSRNKKSPSTVRTYVTAVRMYIKYLKRYLGTPLPEFYDPEMPCITMHSKKGLTDEQLEKYLYYTYSAIIEPYKTLMLLLPVTGLRISEMCNVKLSDIDPNYEGSGSIVFTVIGKGNKTRLVPMLESGRKWLMTYLQGWRRLNGPLSQEAFLFPSGANPGKAVSPKTIRVKIDSIKYRIGAPKMSPHSLRHTWVNLLNRMGVGEFDIAALAGHSSIQTTKKFYHDPHYPSILKNLQDPNKRKDVPL